MRILYDSKNEKYKSKFGTLRENEGCEFNVHIPKECKTKEVKLIFCCEDMSFYSAHSMKKTSEYDFYEVYSSKISIAERGLYFYYFIITTENEEFRLFKQGYNMTNMEEGDYWQLSVLPQNFSVPERFVGNVMYQIFPDRFCKVGECELKDKLRPFVVHENTDELPIYYPDENGVVQNNDFFGGNLKGITSKLDYLKSLNVGTIYLNPIFKAYSNHRYDTADYLKIDEMLGTEQDFVELCIQAHNRGLKIILDGVFSHTGSNSVYFDSENVFKNGAVSNENSPYREWFDFKEYPNEYTSWWGIDTLPCVNENNQSYRDFIIENEDSVVAHWLKLGADGFRLDVADELPDDFILALRNKMKSIKPDSLLIGEVWEDASNKISYSSRRRYFTDGELDSVMNYPFRNAIIDFCLGFDDGHAFKNTVMSIAENYPPDVLNVLMNMLSTHDTVRIMTGLGITTVPPEKSDRAVYKLTPVEEQTATERLLCAVLLQFVLPGMPCIYYGDEVGLQGFEDPFCRRFMDWSKSEDDVVFDFHRTMASLKNRFEMLKKGSINVEVEKTGVIKLERRYENQYFCVVVNVSDETFDAYVGDKILISNNAEISDEKISVKKYGFFCSTN